MPCLCDGSHRNCQLDSRGHGYGGDAGDAGDAGESERGVDRHRVPSETQVWPGQAANGAGLLAGLPKASSAQ